MTIAARESGTVRPRVAAVLSHPIQHFCPQYASWAKRPEFDLAVFFASRHGLDAYRDADFATTVRWQGLTLDFPHTFLPGAETRALGSDIDSAELEAELARYDPAAVVVYGYAQRLQRRALRWAKRHGCRVLMMSDAELRSQRAGWKSQLKRIVLPRVFAPVDLFLSVGDANEDYYRRYGADAARLLRCPFPIDVQLFARTLAERTVLRERTRAVWGASAREVVALMVGKLVPRKRQGDLIAAARQLRASLPGVRIVFAGTGPDEARLRAQAQGLDNVVFAGFVQPQELAAMYVASDLYVHCAEVEPHSLAISEAIHAGLPIVLSDRCGSYGPNDDVQPERNGFVHRCGDVAQLARWIRTLADDAALRERMGAASREISLRAQALAHGDGMAQALARLALLPQAAA